MHLHIIKTAGGIATIKARMAISDSVERAIMKDRMGEKRRKIWGETFVAQAF